MISHTFFFCSFFFSAWTFKKAAIKVFGPFTISKSIKLSEFDTRKLQPILKKKNLSGTRHIKLLNYSKIKNDLFARTWGRINCFYYKKKKLWNYAFCLFSFSFTNLPRFSNIADAHRNSFFECTGHFDWHARWIITTETIYDYNIDYSSLVPKTFARKLFRIEDPSTRKSVQLIDKCSRLTLYTWEVLMNCPCLLQHEEKKKLVIFIDMFHWTTRLFLFFFSLSEDGIGFCSFIDSDLCTHRWLLIEMGNMI